MAANIIWPLRLMKIFALCVFILTSFVVFTLTGSSKIHPVFDQQNFPQSPTADDAEEKYEIKSCLSTDLEIHEQATCRFYALMIDAGSTGTRIHIFEFSHDLQNKAAPFRLENETFAEVKPGLSSFTHFPPDAAKSIHPLIFKAKSTVPKNLWPHTPISLKATAGLRLLSPAQADEIIEEVEKVLRASPFLTNEESASIMTGTDEGIFGWFTLNFLLDRLDALLLKPKELLTVVHDKLTAAALDLGGGSTQVTFRPRLEHTIDEAPADFIKEIRLFGQNIQLYTHSYLGNGLVAARLGSLKLANGPAKRRFVTGCLPPEHQIKWNYSENWLMVRGGNSYSYANCMKEYKNFVDVCQIDKPLELPARDIYLFGYYFDRGFQAGLVNINGGQITVGDFEKAARKACSRYEFGKKHWEPWQCADLTYIAAMLRYGYGLLSDKKLTLVKKLRNMETSWALGASYHLLNTYHEEKTLSKSSMVNLMDQKKISKVNFCNASAGVSANLVLSGCHEFFTNIGMSFVCTRVFGGLTHLLSYFQLLA